MLILNLDMGALDERGELGEDTQYPKSLSQGHHVKNSPLLSSSSSAPSSFPLLFFSFLIKPSGVVRSFETRTPSHVKS